MSDFTTTDLNLAALALALGYELRRISSVGDNVCSFAFDADAGQRAGTAYAENGAIPIRSFTERQNELRRLARAHHANERRRRPTAA